MWQDDHTNNPGYEGTHNFTLDVWKVGGGHIGYDSTDIDTNGGDSGESELVITASNVVVEEQFDCSISATAEDIPGTGYDSNAWRVIFTVVSA